MASAAALSSSSAAARVSHLPARAPSLCLLSKPVPLSLSFSSSPKLSAVSVPPLRPPPGPLVARRGRPVSASADEPPPLAVVEGLEAVPEPVEAQLDASSPGGPGKGEDVFAVVMIGSRQYIVFPGRFLCTQRLKGANANDKIILNKVLLVGTRSKTYIGQPVVTNAAVHAVVEEQGLDPKVIVFKYKKKKKYRRTIGHRQPNTRIRITGITGYQDFPFETLPEGIPA